MIIFVEDRALVVDGYKSKFTSVGETLVRMPSDEFVGWIESCSQAERASVEAFLIGQCDEPQKKIATIRRYTNVPIVALFESRSLEQLIWFFRQGVDDVVAKPVHFDELLIRIACIKKRQLQTQPQGEGKAITVYFDGRDPEIRGEPIMLPRRERRILEYLASINGRRVTKAQIFGAIYGIFDEHIDENVVESHISKLRKKLRKFIGYDPIESKRYLGYRLQPEAVAISRMIPDKIVA